MRSRNCLHSCSSRTPGFALNCFCVVRFAHHFSFLCCVFCLFVFVLRLVTNVARVSGCYCLSCCTCLWLLLSIILHVSLAVIVYHVTRVSGCYCLSCCTCLWLLLSIMLHVSLAVIVYHVAHVSAVIVYHALPFRFSLTFLYTSIKSYKVEIS